MAHSTCSARSALHTSARTAKAILLIGALIAAMLAVATVNGPAAHGAATGSITLDVVSARTVNNGPGFVHQGDVVNADAPAGSKYKWLINVDDTGDPGTATNPGTRGCLPSRGLPASTFPTAADAAAYDATYADSCQWPSVRNTSGLAPIVAQGDDTDLNSGTALDGLPAGKYLISVTADGFKIDGAHFTVPPTGGSQPVTVAMQPLPLPLTTLRLQVFNDNAPVDSTYEVDAEQGLRGFTATLTDVLGLVSTDYYGNALCTRYLRVNAQGNDVSAPIDSPLPIAFDDNNRPIIDTRTSTGRCVSDATGLIVIPNLGPNRYAATVAPPKPVPGQGYRWVQTTTLEGGHDHDIWQQEGETGNDTEQTKGSELVPATKFGFVKTQALKVPATNPPTGEIKGVAIAGLPYIGGANGQTVPETGFAGAKSGGPIKRPWVALSDLDAGDAQIYVGRGAVNGSFDIKNVPNGTYQLSIWDTDQDYILWSFNVEVRNGGVSNVGNKMIVGWFTHIYGKVFIDSNANGKLDPGEQTVPRFLLTVRERDNSLMDQASNTVTTDDSGFYNLRETYPLGKWLILEGFDTRYKTTGISYKGENESKWTTQLGSMVDVNFLPIIGLGGEIDWGVQPYDRSSNGGIVGTVTYDTTRNELDPADAVTESYQPGIPGVKVHLYVPQPCTAPLAQRANECRQGHAIYPLYQTDADGNVLYDGNGNPIKTTDPNRGELIKGPEVQDAYTSETWSPPRGCTARQYNNKPLTDQQALPPFGTFPDPANPGQTTQAMCVEAPMMGVATGTSDSTPGNGSQTVNGNYGFATSKINLYPPADRVHNPDGLALYAPLPNGEEQDLRPQDYIVSVDIPNDPVDGKPMYKVTDEESVNIFDGDTYLPQQNYPPATPAIADNPPPGDQPSATPPSQPPSQQAGIISPCAGVLHTVHVTNPNFIAGGGSPFEGQDRPSCQSKLVTVRSGQATAPNFNLYTDVPIPTHFWGLTLNDLGLTLDKRSANYGEALGIPWVPVGLYDWSGRLVDTVHTDFNGLYEALEPSTDTYNCPVPAGPCPNMYRFVGNDPGQPGALNPDYNPRYRTIATNFQAWPGLYTVTDEAPTQVAATALAPDTTVADTTICNLDATQPQLLAASRPYVRTTDSETDRTVTLTGFGFGSSGTLTANNQPVTTASWTDTAITFTVPAGATQGFWKLAVSANGLSTYNGLTLPVIGSATAQNTATNPKVFEVGPGRAYDTIQKALQAAVPSNAARYDLVAVWPNAQTTDNPRGEYTENVVVHHHVRIQGVGPGGFRPDGSYVPGSVIDGAGFNPDNPSGTAWINLVGGLTYSGDPAVPDAAVVTVLDDPTNRTAISDSAYPMSIDGFDITGGAQSDFAGNVNEITGVVKTPYGATGAAVTQGGGIYVHNNVRNLRVTDNIINGNSGSYGGAIRVGTPYTGDNRNYGLTLADNQIRDNGGTNLAGGIGLFTGSDGYSIDHNAICGNFSAEYGGAISAFGYQAHLFSGGNGGSITKNRIWFNASYDEGGGVMIAGELPANPTQLSQGSGPVTIDSNVIQANLANDDGGGIRLLQTSGSNISRLTPGTISITNNTVANNVSAHEGGGIALDDAVFVNIVNDTIVKNLTTATAVTSNGQPAPAGLSTATNSDPLQARLRNTALFPASGTLANTTFSKPSLLNDVFWDNRAGNFRGGYVYGIGGTLPNGTANTVNHWDMGNADSPGALLTPTNSVLQTTTGTALSATNSSADPLFKDPYDVTVNILANRSYPAFRQAVIVAEILPPNLMGDYHVTTGSSARGRGAASVTTTWGTGLLGFRYTVSAPSKDIDGEPRPCTGTTRYDAGSDQMTP